MSSNLAKLISIFLIGVAGCRPAELVTEETGEEPDRITWTECSYQIGDHICNLELQDQNGNLFKLYDYVGQPIILDFSTMWCGYCQVAAADVASVQSRYDNKDLVYATVLVENTSGNPAVVIGLRYLELLILRFLREIDL